MRAGWEQAGAEPQKWYRRDFESGPLSFCIDLWSTDNDDREWAFCCNNQKREQMVAKSADGAMASAEVIVAGYLRAAAKACKQP